VVAVSVNAGWQQQFLSVYNVGFSAAVGGNTGVSTVPEWMRAV
jgi:hypothetical protein